MTTVPMRSFQKEQTPIFFSFVAVAADRMRRTQSSAVAP